MYIYIYTYIYIYHPVTIQENDLSIHGTGESLRRVPTRAREVVDLLPDEATRRVGTMGETTREKVGKLDFIVITW